MDIAGMRTNRTIIGTPAQCRERIAALAEACGLTGWMFHLNYGKVPAERVLDEMELFARAMMPAFQDEAARTTVAKA